MSQARKHAPCIFVRWVDTSSEEDWKDYDGPINLVVESVCWLIDCNNDALVVSSHHCRAREAAEWGHIWHIPHGAIKTWYEIEPLKKPW